MDAQGFKEVSIKTVELAREGGVFKVFRNSAQTGGFSHLKTYSNEETGEEVTMTTKDFNSTYSKEERKGFQVIDCQAVYQESRFKELCSFEFETLEVESETFVFDGNFQLPREFFEKNEDVLMINEDFVSCYDCSEYDVLEHNAKLPARVVRTSKVEKVLGGLKEQAQAIKNNEELSEEERTQELLAILGAL